MAHNSTNTAIVETAGIFQIKEGLLENACREYDFIQKWVVVGINILWIHSPAQSVHGFAIETPGILVIPLKVRKIVLKVLVRRRCNTFIVCIQGLW
jgi:hypothetical protein